MKLNKKAWLYGLAIWVIPFVVAMMIFPLRQNERPLFESIMPVIVTLGAVIFANWYFKNLQTDFLKTGVTLGVLWFVISWAIDTLMFAWGPMQMSFGEYIKDIGVTYLIVPTVTIGYGWLLEKRFARPKPQANA